MNGTVAILVEYIGEQTKPILPVAFVADPAHLAQLDTGRDAFDVQNLPPRVCICTADELEQLAAAATSAVTQAGTETQSDPTLAVTIAQTSDVVQTWLRGQIGRTEAAALLEALRASVRAPAT
ncbi:MAG TPA: hypothetical protein VF698_19670, partial [Thermoanaerobaculia bacterium]